MSLRSRLLLVLGAVAFVSLVIADAVTYQEIRSFLYSRIDQSLETSHIPVEHAVSSFAPPGAAVPGSQGPFSFEPQTPGRSFDTPSRPSARLGATQDGSGCADLFQMGLEPGTFVEVRSPGGSVVESCSITLGPDRSTAKPQLPKTITGLRADASDFGEPTAYLTVPSNSPGGYRARASLLRAGPYAGGQLVVAVPLASTASTLGRLFDVELAVTAAALLSALAIGWWLVRVGMHPLRAIESTADAIAAGELDQRVPGENGKTEVGRLARALNVMLGRIEQAFAQRDRTETELRESEARMRRFVADASHELRTPLAAVSAYAELFERGASTRPEDLERVMEGIGHETARMGRLVEDLLLLARLDEGRPLEMQPLELVELAGESVHTARTVAPSWPVRLEASTPVEVIGDRERLRQVVDNLLANVRTHTPAGTSAVVEVRRDGQHAILTVSDDGPGLSADRAAHVFERFYRSDPARSRSRGGAGLGLSIVASIVEAHDGRASVSSSDAGGACFAVSLPISPDDAGTGPDGDGAGTNLEQAPDSQLSLS